MTTIGTLRFLTQILSLAVVNIGFTQTLKFGIACPVFFCYGCPWAGFACPIGVLQTFTAVGIFPYLALGTLGIFALSLGRIWCGWACPFGMVQDLTARIRKRNDVANLPPVPWLKYVSLAGIMIAAWIAAETLFCKVCPAGSLFAAIPHRFASADQFEFGTFFWVHVATLAMSLVLFVLFARFWCRYLCPLGAILGIFNRVSLIRVRIDRERCTDCGHCLSNCPANINHASDIGTATDCVQCAKCIDSCPAHAIRVSASLRG